MLNKAPIFINGFAFGGTNLIMNLIGSHPDVCLLSGETHEVFYSKPNNKLLDKAIRRLFYFPIQKAAGQHIFWKWYFDERNPIAKTLMHYIDLIFYADKMTTGRNRFKAENVKYKFSEVSNSRFLAKNVNGVVFACKQFAEMYSDATFVSMVRSGLPLCEGYVRRGWKADEVGRIYESVCQQMITDSKNIPRYEIVRFEDMVSDPLSFMRKVYGLAGLDINKVSQVRMQAKRSMDKDGTRKYTFGGTKDRETHWFNLEDIDKFVRKDVDKNQAGQLSQQDRDVFVRLTEKSLDYFGYL